MKLKKRLASFAVAGIMAVMSCVSLASSAISLKDMDVNGDGTVSLADAVYISQYLNGAFEPTDLTIFDVNKNGIVSPMDAYIIQLYGIGLLEVDDK
ncbi:MAG: dockerin type I repeat-containing protein [Ruminococcus sp.]|nr:dockerin type I repeat-containing protein [Ruminococcus sp.]